MSAPDPPPAGAADRGSPGRLIVFEGGEASGKSTQAARLAAALGALLTREPGGTAVGEHLRRLVLGPGGDEALAVRAEALLLLADRAQHVAAVIRPALAAGHDVVSDRYTGSTLAYQGYGRGLDVGELRRLADWASEGLRPDLVILLDVPPRVARARMSASGRGPDRLEAAGEEFHRRVREGFLALAAACPDTWRVVDGTAPVETVAAQVRTAVEACLGTA